MEDFSSKMQMAQNVYRDHLFKLGELGPVRKKLAGLELSSSKCKDLELGFAIGPRTYTGNSQEALIGSLLDQIGATIPELFHMGLIRERDATSRRYFSHIIDSVTRPFRYHDGPESGGIAGFAGIRLGEDGAFENRVIYTPMCRIDRIMSNFEEVTEWSYTLFGK